jgi:hypothetical protein
MNMNHFIEAILSTQPATWIAIGSLAVSIAALNRSSPGKMFSKLDYLIGIPSKRE